MAASEYLPNAAFWRCLHCLTPLISGDLGLRCPGCGKQYPVIAGVPILVKEPATYLRSQRASLMQASRDARQRIDLIDRSGCDAGLPNVTIKRNRDVFMAEIAQAETFLALLEPVTKALEALAEGAGESQGVRRSGWNFDTLLPYLLRDWTNTSEFQAANARIGAALKLAFPDPSGKSVVFAGCGAGGLLAETSPQFARVMGFDLTLPMLAAARQLLDGKSLDLALPHAVAKLGRVSLRRRDPLSADTHGELVAMDALDTAFADGSVDCVVTMFLTDLMPDPRSLADEIHRILSDNGVWINYGPSGNLKSLWRFDLAEGPAFFETAGFTVVQIEENRTTNLDVGRDYPSLSARIVMCSLTSARKTGQADDRPRPATPGSDRLSEVVPQHFPGANLIQGLGAEESRKILFHYERIPGQGERLEISGKVARIMALVDGKRTVHEIADLLKHKKPPQPVEETLRAFARYFDQGLLSWRDRDS